jgi:hypothetical protein
MWPCLSAFEEFTPNQLPSRLGLPGQAPSNDPLPSRSVGSPERSHVKRRPPSLSLPKPAPQRSSVAQLEPNNNRADDADADDDQDDVPLRELKEREKAHRVSEAPPIINLDLSFDTGLDDDWGGLLGSGGGAGGGSAGAAKEAKKDDMFGLGLSFPGFVSDSSEKKAQEDPPTPAPPSPPTNGTSHDRRMSTATDTEEPRPSSPSVRASDERTSGERSLYDGIRQSDESEASERADRRDSTRPSTADTKRLSAAFGPSRDSRDENEARQRTSSTGSLLPYALSHVSESLASTGELPGISRRPSVAATASSAPPLTTYYTPSSAPAASTEVPFSRLPPRSPPPTTTYRPPSSAPATTLSQPTLASPPDDSLSSRLHSSSPSLSSTPNPAAEHHRPITRNGSSGSLFDRISPSFSAKRRRSNASLISDQIHHSVQSDTSSFRTQRERSISISTNDSTASPQRRPQNANHTNAPRPLTAYSLDKELPPTPPKDRVMGPAKDAAKDAAASLKKGLQRFRSKNSSSRPSTADSAWMDGRAQAGGRGGQPRIMGSFGGSMGSQSRGRGMSALAMTRRQSDFGDSRRVDEKEWRQEEPEQHQDHQGEFVGYPESTRMRPVKEASSRETSTDDILVSGSTSFASPMILYVVIVTDLTAVGIVGRRSQTRRLGTYWTRLSRAGFCTVERVVDAVFPALSCSVDGSSREVFRRRRSPCQRGKRALDRLRHSRRTTKGTLFAFPVAAAPA